MFPHQQFQSSHVFVSKLSKSHIFLVKPFLYSGFVFSRVVTPEHPTSIWILILWLLSTAVVVNFHFLPFHFHFLSKFLYQGYWSLRWLVVAVNLAMLLILIPRARWVHKYELAVNPERKTSTLKDAKEPLIDIQCPKNRNLWITGTDTASALSLNVNFSHFCHIICLSASNLGDKQVVDNPRPKDGEAAPQGLHKLPKVEGGEVIVIGTYCYLVPINIWKLNWIIKHNQNISRICTNRIRNHGFIQSR